METWVIIYFVVLIILAILMCGIVIFGFIDAFDIVDIFRKKTFECLYKEGKNCKYSVSSIAVIIPEDIYITGTCSDCDWYGDGTRLEKYAL